MDALACSRSGDGAGGGASARLLSQLLTELDGIEALRRVVIVGATNRPDLLDPALLRPGRLDRLVCIGLPDRAARCEIAALHLRKMPHAAPAAAATGESAADEVKQADPAGGDQEEEEEKEEGGGVSAARIADHTRGYSGAEVVAICREAALAALEEDYDVTAVMWRHFERALTRVKPQTTQKMIDFYSSFGGGKSGNAD
jgi:AAA family ATPase